jgi:hypothetical protein
MSSDAPTAERTTVSASEGDASVVEGEVPNTRETFYAEFGRQMLKDSLKAAGDAVQRLATISAPMLGGSAVFLRAENIDLAPRAIAVSCLVLALAVSLVASLPLTRRLCVENPYAVERAVAEGLVWKGRAARVASFLLLLGLALGAIGVLLKG